MRWCVTELVFTKRQKNGVKVSTEENFLFSYNITSLNTSIKKVLNKERTNVGFEKKLTKIIGLFAEILITSNKLADTPKKKWFFGLFG